MKQEPRLHKATPAAKSRKSPRSRRRMRQRSGRGDVNRLHTARVKVHNREFAVIMRMFVTVFLAMAVYFVYFLGYKAPSFISNPYNVRLTHLSDRITRGNIMSADGQVLATTQAGSDGRDTRVYPYGELFAHAVGYDKKGMAGLELDENFTLLQSHSSVLEKAKDTLTGQKYQGDSVVTTLDTSLQKAASDALGNYKGAVVALDPSTGQVLAMVSKPDFDPGSISANWDAYTGDPESGVLINRATQGKYPPGSTFKILTTLEYLNENNMSDAGFSYDCKGSFTKSGFTIHCYDNHAHGEENLTQAFGNSCNTAFSNIGLSLDQSSMYDFAQKMLFNRNLPTKLSHVSKSSYSLKTSESPALTMQTAIGQGNTTVTPLHMAMIVSAIANDGVLMEPYMVDSVVNDAGTTIHRTAQTRYGQLLTTQQAQMMQTYMRYVVTDGTARSINTDAYTTYGKTGTAEYNSKGDAHGWFVGYAEKDGRQIAVAVIMEGSGSGGTHAAPAADKVFRAYFQ